MQDLTQRLGKKKRGERIIRKRATEREREVEEREGGGERGRGRDTLKEGGYKSNPGRIRTPHTASSSLRPFS